jgi:hypothetical protein
MYRPRVLKAEEDHPGSGFTREQREVAEVEIERENDPILGQGFHEDLLVGSSVQSLLTKMHRLVPEAA